jgi:tetratricopeptide (TPR) repeat protein
MAPEQAAGDLARIDTRTDVYGLGAILYEVLTGQPPFTGPSSEEVLSQVRNLQPDRPRVVAAGTHPAIEAVCLKSLAKRPEDRYPDAGTVAEEVTRFLADEPVTAWPEPLGVRLRRWSRRHRALVTSGVAALAVAVPILVAGLLLLNRSEQRERTSRERAQASYRRALTAADAMTEELARGVRPLLGTQRAAVLEILDRSNRVYEELLDDPDPGPEVLESQARALILFAELYRETNNTPAARKASERALEICDRLLQTAPERREVLLLQATARHRRAWVLLDQGFDRESIAEFQACVRDLRALDAEADPKLAATLLASAYTFLGNEFLTVGDRSAAETAYRIGLDLREAAARAIPGSTPIQISLAISLEKWGRFRYSQGEEPDGLALLRRARAVLETTTAGDPWNSETHLHLVRILNSFAQLEPRREEMQESLGKAETVLERFARRDPGHLIWQREALRFRFLKQRLETRGRRVGTEARRADFRNQIVMLNELLTMLAKSVADDPEYFLGLADVANIRSRLGERHIDLLSIAGEGRDHLDAAAALLAGSLEEYNRLVARSPENVEWQQGRIYCRYQISRLSAAREDARRALIDCLVHHTDEIRFYRRLVGRYPGVDMWANQLAHTGNRVIFGFTREPTLTFFQKAGTDPAVVAALVDLARELDTPPPALPVGLTRAWTSTRGSVADKLAKAEQAGVLDDKGKRLLQALRAK